MIIPKTVVVALVSLVSHALAWEPNTERHENWDSNAGGYGHPRCHDHSFIPDHVLRITYETISIGCQTRPSVVINGSLPGPELRLRPGKTSWIRVYNDMTEFNATIVGRLFSVLTGRSFANQVIHHSIGMVSANALQYFPTARRLQANGR
jgi:FtsP/CotA-like multicopper oxidase with cupredoxin domain